MTSEVPPVEAALGALVAELEFDALPAEALAGARRLMQDQLALQVGCETLPWCRAVIDYARGSHAPGRSRVVVTGDAMSAGDAAFVNATLGHSFEYDDAHRASSSHPGSTVVSAALAIGEEDGASMRDVLLGIVAGYEAYTRVGVLAAPDLLERGFHPHALLAPFGAAAVVARMRGFDAEQTTHALAIAMSHSAGTTEYTSSGGSVKRVHAGIGTRNGIRAAEMAAAGITGPLAYLTGSKGFLPVFKGRPFADDAVERFAPDRPFEITKVWIKPYCCCGCCHGFVDGARTFVGRADDIDAVELGIQSGGDVVVGNRNVNAYSPSALEQLQYSLPFQFALAATGHGNGFTTHHDYFEGRLKLLGDAAERSSTHQGADGDVARLAQRVRITPKPDLDTAYPGKWVADIAVTFRDGTTERLFVEDSTGTSENPIPQDELDAKARDLTVGRLGPEQTEALLAAIASDDLDAPASSLVDTLIVR
ncbi:MmgE/PrpD family protein [Actinomycetospora endophytica]|uniref:MmgE/PrpD family protein n=1 Tax=Actinomycetospora endophytica TaxID=2291215 RepID=A0ABS8PIA2_9PSEU|nr:MmgE/PrpD family protein [Actinomycetospora endophytica]MCD2197662.1 MmgE/PrpD family protein [Actinomycetospora endophytica]